MKYIGQLPIQVLCQQARRLLPAVALVVMALFSGCAGVKDTSRSFNTVVIDAGHGGHDRGARARSNGLAEKTVALDVAQKVEQRLRAAGFRTRMTRTGDEFVGLDERAAISNRQSNAVFVSIHFNHAPTSRANGAETYYNSSASAALASKIQNNLARFTPTADRGVKTANFRVLRKADFPAVLVECGFLSNPAEASRCASPAYRDALAERIASGIIEQRHGLSAYRQMGIAAAQ